MFCKYAILPGEYENNLRGGGTQRIMRIRILSLFLFSPNIIILSYKIHEPVFECILYSLRNHRCVRGANRTLRRKYCHPYSAHGQKGTKKTEKDVKPEVCRSILGDELLFATPAEQEWRENLFVTYSIRFSKKRRDVRKRFFYFA